MMDGRRLKFLNIVDEYSRMCLAIRVGRRCKAMDAIDTIEEFSSSIQHPPICEWTMALSSLPMHYRSGAQVVNQVRNTCRQAHLGKIHLWNHSIAYSGMNY
jgi:hypothetical protein